MPRVLKDQLSYWPDNTDINFSAHRLPSTRHHERTSHPKKEPSPLAFAQLSFVLAEPAERYVPPEPQAPIKKKKPQRNRPEVVKKQLRAQSILGDIQRHDEMNTIIAQSLDPLFFLIDGYGGNMNFLCGEPSGQFILEPFKGDSFYQLSGQEFQGIIVDAHRIGEDLRLTIRSLLLSFLPYLAAHSMIIISELRDWFDRPTVTQKKHHKSLIPAGFTLTEIEVPLAQETDEFIRDYYLIPALRDNPQVTEPVESIDDIMPWVVDERPRKVNPKEIDMRVVAPKLIRLIGVGIERPDAQYIIGRPIIKGGDAWCSVDVRDGHGESYSGSGSQERRLTPSVASKVFALMDGKPSITFSATDALGELAHIPTNKYSHELPDNLHSK